MEIQPTGSPRFDSGETEEKIYDWSKLLTPDEEQELLERLEKKVIEDRQMDRSALGARALRRFPRKRFNRFRP